MKKINNILLAILVVFLCFSSSKVLAGEVVIEVSNDKIYLDDLFYDVSAFSNTAIAAAPKFGEKLILSKQKLQLVAKKYSKKIKRDWLDKRIILVRSGKLIDQQEIIDLLQADFKERFKTQTKFTFKFHAGSKLYVPTLRSNLPIIKNLQIDQRTSQFQALVISPNDKYGDEIVEIFSGSFKEMVEVPVAKKFIKRGEIVEDSDIEMKSLARSDIRGTLILSKNKIIGKEAKANLKIGDNFNGHSLADPVMVKRGSMVEVSFVKNRINLTTSMFALESGKLNQQISLRNINSKKKVLATVVGFDKVEIN